MASVTNPISPIPEGAERPLPATAQVAHQQATFLGHYLARKTASQKRFTFRDKGSLVSLGSRSAVGYLVGNEKSNKQVYVGGGAAKTLYVAIYWLHQYSVHGALSTARLFIVDRLARVRRFGVKAY